jgi:hypothetical protein
LGDRQRSRQIYDLGAVTYEAGIAADKAKYDISGSEAQMQTRLNMT